MNEKEILTWGLGMALGFVDRNGIWAWRLGKRMGGFVNGKQIWE